LQRRSAIPYGDPALGDHQLIGIGAVERETGIAKETLRTWERRYGFPSPQRSASGERQYHPEDVAKLKLLRQLQNRGFRPHVIVPKPLHELRQLDRADSALEGLPVELGRSLVGDAVLILRRHGSAALQDWLDQLVVQRGLEHFVLQVARPLSHAAAAAREAGELRLFEEHIIAQQLQRTIWCAIKSLPPAPERRPRILLTTLPPEQHVLGLLKINALLALKRTRCLWLGPATPVEEVALCAREHGIDIVALAFSADFPRQRVASELFRLRELLSAETRIWASGEGAAGLPRHIRGVVRLASMEDAVSALEAGDQSSTSRDA